MSLRKSKEVHLKEKSKKEEKEGKAIVIILLSQNRRCNIHY